jgi:uncharacterized caspase-like protein
MILRERITHKHILFILILLISLLPIPSEIKATSRGIHAVSQEGQNLFLYKDYHALVIGVSNYDHWPKLPHADDDAREVADKLKKLGYGVDLILDPAHKDLRDALNKLVYFTGKEENRAILVFYAGHGETELLADSTKMGYIIPRDCPILKKDPMGFAAHAISMREIEAVSLKIRSKHVIMLFDSCFSGSLFSLTRSLPANISDKSRLPVRQYITAGTEDEQVPDKSMFKRSFLIGLDGDADLTGDGYITGSELGIYLSEKVVNYTKGNQHPQYGKINNPELDRGDFIFVPLEKSKTTGPSKTTELVHLGKKTNIAILFKDTFANSADWNLGSIHGERAGKAGSEHIFIDPNDGANRTQKSICMNYKLGLEREPLFKKRIILAKIRNRNRLDCKEFEGIEFFIKSTPEARVQFVISDRQKGLREFEHWYFNLKVNDRWKFFRIPFASLLLNKRVAEYYDTNKILELDKVHKIDWIINEKQNPKGAIGKIWVDEIKFY